MSRSTVIRLLCLIALPAALAAVFLSLPPSAQSTAAPVSKGYLALTFDDGPWPDFTEPLLDGLAERGVKATFFLIGAQVGQFPETVKREAAEGHQVGLHTWDHLALAGQSRETIERQISSCLGCLRDLLGPESFMLRPPYGFTDKTLQDCAGMPIIHWSVDTEDWKDRNAARIVSEAVASVKDGDILLMHDSFDTSVTAALQIVDALLAEGYRFVTVEDLFALRGITPENGVVYSALPPAPSAQRRRKGRAV